MFCALILVSQFQFEDIMAKFNPSPLLLAALLLAPSVCLAQPSHVAPRADLSQDRQKLATERAQQKQIDAQIKVLSKQIHDEMVAERRAQGPQRDALRTQINQQSTELAQLKNTRSGIWSAEHASQVDMYTDATHAGHDANAHTK